MGMPIAFFEVVSDDHERAQKFYAALFDWQVAADPGMGGYGLVDTGCRGGCDRRGHRAVRGTRRHRGQDLRPGARPAGALDRAEELGGKALVPPTDLPGDFGRFALLADPDGNPVGLWA